MAGNLGPATQRLTLVIGDTFRGTGTVINKDGSAYDLTGVAGVLQIRSALDAPLIEGEITVDADPTTGKFTWRFEAEDTAGLTPGQYPYACRLDLPDNIVQTVLIGTVYVIRGVVEP